MIINQRITIIKIRKPLGENINQELQWLGSSLGLFSLRDKDKSCFRIFIELLKASKKGEGLTSDELAYKLSLTRGTVVHHLHKLINAGIVVLDKNRYVLRVSSLASLVDEIERDTNRFWEDLKKTASEMDERLGM